MHSTRSAGSGGGASLSGEGAQRRPGSAPTAKTRRSEPVIQDRGRKGCRRAGRPSPRTRARTETPRIAHSGAIAVPALARPIVRPLPAAVGLHDALAGTEAVPALAIAVAVREACFDAHHHTAVASGAVMAFITGLRVALAAVGALVASGRHPRQSSSRSRSRVTAHRPHLGGRPSRGIICTGTGGVREASGGVSAEVIGVPDGDRRRVGARSARAQPPRDGPDLSYRGSRGFGLEGVDGEAQPRRLGAAATFERYRLLFVGGRNRRRTIEGSPGTTPAWLHGAPFERP